MVTESAEASEVRTSSIEFYRKFKKMVAQGEALPLWVAELIAHSLQQLEGALSESLLQDMPPLCRDFLSKSTEDDYLVKRMNSPDGFNIVAILMNSIIITLMATMVFLNSAAWLANPSNQQPIPQHQLAGRAHQFMRWGLILTALWTCIPIHGKGGELGSYYSHYEDCFFWGSVGGNVPIRFSQRCSLVMYEMAPYLDTAV